MGRVHEQDGIQGVGRLRAGRVQNGADSCTHHSSPQTREPRRVAAPGLRSVSCCAHRAGGVNAPACKPMRTGPSPVAEPTVTPCPSSMASLQGGCGGQPTDHHNVTHPGQPSHPMCELRPGPTHLPTRRGTPVAARPPRGLASRPALPRPKPGSGTGVTSAGTDLIPRASRPAPGRACRECPDPRRSDAPRLGGVGAPRRQSTPCAWGS